MFELFFKYPLAAFGKGDLVLLGRWPVAVLVGGILLAAALLAIPMWLRRRAYPARVKPAVVWLLQSTLVAVVLILLWQPALSIATLRPQQNVVAIVVDDSRSMAIADGGRTRRDHVVSTLNAGFIKGLEDKFQVRLYRAGAGVERISKLDELAAAGAATRLGDSLKQVAAEASSLPIGAVILFSDGSDNAGGVDLPTITEIKRQRIPIHTVGFGREKLDRDVEVVDVQLPARALAGSRLSAVVTFQQWGYKGGKARLNVKDGSKVLASREVTLKTDGAEQSEQLVFNAGDAAARNLHFSVDQLASEENPRNNSLNRLLAVEASKPRILYLEGDPKWEYKFIRRAIELDSSLNLTSMLRTTQNKIYRQGIADPKELEQGFPAKVEELFGFQGVIIGGVEASYFTPSQLELLKQFVDRRGGGLLFLGARSGLSDGGWGKSPLADLLPVTLPESRTTFRRDPANVELAPFGRDSLITRIEDDPDRNVERWKKLPYLANYQPPGTPKSGAVVLANLKPTSGGIYPLLITQNYGRGRTAVLATSGTWRWQMSQPLTDGSHEMFWQQLLRWLVLGTSGQVISSVPKSVFADETRVALRAEVRDKTYLPVSDARAEARIMGPDGQTVVELQPDAANPGIYTAEWSAGKPGAYVAETVVTRGDQEVGRDVTTFRREDGVAENFHVQQNRELLEKLASQTGGRYYRPEELRKLGSEIAYSEAGISTRETRDLWNMPVVFLVLLALRGSEWLLRRRWGVV